METTIQTEQHGDLTRYYVRNSDWGWGIIIIDPRNGMVLCYTDYGNYNYNWSHRGEQSIFQFIGKISFDYAMSKFLGAKQTVNVERTLLAFRKHVLEYRREESHTAEDAREMWDALNEAEDEGFHGSSLGHFLAASPIAENIDEWYDFICYEHPSEARGFWDHIWTPLVAHIQENQLQLLPS